MYTGISPVDAAGESLIERLGLWSSSLTSHTPTHDAPDPISSGAGVSWSRANPVSVDLTRNWPPHGGVASSIVSGSRVRLTTMAQITLAPPTTTVSDRPGKLAKSSSAAVTVGVDTSPSVWSGVIQRTEVAAGSVMEGTAERSR